MVAVIKTGTSLKNTLQYNEQKLRQNVAELIHSLNFAKDTDQLGFTDKIKTFEKLTSLNERTKVNSVHISLNFDPSEKLDKETLQQIAEAYLQKIGFANQPCLVYQHHDSGHPHIHLVTTNIQWDGSRIKLHNIGRLQSEKARKEIEEEFKLVKAQKQQLKQVQTLKPVNATKVQYGKSETKRAITNVLDTVLHSFKYASLPELNAVLRQYNVLADRGSEHSKTFKNNGLVYRVLDGHGQKIGAPVKASDIYNNPGLKLLTEKFRQNEQLKEPYKRRIKNAIDLSLLKQREPSMERLVKALQQQGIEVVLRQNEKGILYGITYIDYQSKCVFNGSDLGKPYSANQIQERCRQEQTLQPQKQQLKLQLKPTFSQAEKSHRHDYVLAQPADMKQALKELIQTTPENVPFELKQDQIRKRKRQRLHL